MLSAKRVEQAHPQLVHWWLLIHSSGHCTCRLQVKQWHGPPLLFPTRFWLSFIHVNPCFEGIWFSHLTISSSCYLSKAFLPPPAHVVPHSQTPISPKSILPLSLLSLLTLPQHHHLQQATILTLLQQQISSSSSNLDNFLTFL